MRILVVEDEAAVAQAIQALLVNQHYLVDIASDGLRGLEMAATYPYDLIVLDVGLPQLDGISLCRRLRAQEIQTPILLLTGPAAPAQATALNAGADDSLTKPFDAAELLTRVQSLLHQGSRQTPQHDPAPDCECGEVARCQSEAHLRLFIAASSDVVYRMGADWREMRCLEGKTFLVNTEVPSETWIETYIPPAERPRVRGAIEAAIQGKSFFELEHQVICRDGSIGWVFSRALPLLNEQGEIMEWLGAARDITERKRSEVALKRSKAQLQTVANLVPDLLWTSAPDGTTDWHNQRWLDYTGQSLAADGQSWLDAVHPQDQAPLTRRYREAVEAGQPLQQEHRIRRHDGEYRWFVTKAHPLKDDKGQVIEMHGAATDIHEILMAREALRASDAKLSRIFENAGAAIGEFLAYPDRTYVHGFMSVGCERVYGYSQTEMMGDTHLWLSRVVPEDLETVIETGYEQIFAGESFSIEYRFRDKTDTVRWIAETLTSQWDEAAACWQVTTVAINISDRKQAELALRDSQALVQQQLAEIETIYQSAPIGLNVLDTNLRFVRINEQLAEMNGLPVVAHLGRTVREVLPELADTVEALLRPILATGDPLLKVEITGETPAQPGVERTWLESFLPLKDGDRVIGISTVCEEITERKAAELALRQSEAKNRAILAALPDLLIRVGADGVYREVFSSHCDFEVLSVDCIGRSMFDVLPTEMAHRAYFYLQRALETGELQVFEQEVPIGERLQYEEARVVKSDEDEVLFVMLDISERKQAEFALQQQVRQEQLLADIAQEIRQSLDLNQVLHSTVNRIREWLGCDRVIIFRFCPDWQGEVIMESVGDQWTAILSTTITDPCFEEKFIQPYRQGHVSVLNDIHQPGLEPCYIGLLQQFQVQAGLAVPILQGNHLWGLLIAHQCSAPRQWQPNEIQMLKRLATQVAIASYQAELYAQVHAELAQRAHMQTVLQESEERFRTLSAAAPVGILQANADGICLYANEAWQQMSGLSLEDSLANGWLQAIHPEDRDRVCGDWQALVDNQQEGQAEFRLLTPDQAVRWISARVATIRSAADAIAGYVSTYEDITERKLTEQALRESEQRLQAILDHSPAMIYVLDPQNRYLLVNCSYAKQLDSTPAELIGKSLYEVWPTEIAAGYAAQNRTLLETGQLLQIEDTAPLADGVHSYITVKFPLVDAAGNPYAIGGLSTDITAMKNLEAQFYQAQRLESLGTLAAGIAHDLNNVFTPILTMAQVLQLTQKEFTAPGREQLKLIETSAKRGGNLVRQILNITRTSQGERQAVDLAMLLHEEIEIMQQSFPKSIEIRLEVPISEGDIPPVGLILADPTYLHQIILNLCINARDAMPDGGTLTLSATTVWVDEALAAQSLGAHVGRYAVVTVADTGTGIPPEVQARMFDPFFTTKAPTQGTGLGLSTVRSLVEVNEGFIRVFSRGQGTQFKVYFPLLEEASAKSSPPSPDEAATPDNQGTLVLVAEDEAMVRSVLQSLLESEGFQAVVAQDGTEALERYRQHPGEIQLVITDIMMPNRDGISLIRELKTLNPELGILALSGVSTQGEKALAAGANYFLPKPFNLEEILNCIGKLLEGGAGEALRGPAAPPDSHSPKLATDNLS